MYALQLLKLFSLLAKVYLENDLLQEVANERQQSIRDTYLKK